MMRTDVERVALVGAGVVGNAWAAQLLSHGVEVCVADTSAEAEATLMRDLTDHLAVLHRLGHRTRGWRRRVRFTRDLAAAVDGADFVQESVSENEEIKRDVFRDLDRLVPADVVIASSTSTLMPSRLAEMCARSPERVLVGHPFNPVHLVPLVEVVGHDGTSPSAVDAAMRFYDRMGKRPVHVRREMPGHLANRLQAALWREAYSLVERGAASVADIDAAIAHGPGLRWAILGPLALQHLSGGPGGMRHALSHLGPATQKVMDDLGSPQLDDDLAARLVEGVEEELGGRDIAAVRRERDALLTLFVSSRAKARNLPW